MAGYNRISPNPFVDGAIIEATDFDTEFGALDLAFGISGHTHNGTDSNGPKIDTAGLALNAVDSTILDETDSSYAVAGMTIDSLTITSGTAVTSIDTDLTSVSATDNTLASAKAIKTYVDAQVTASDLDFQGDSGGALSIDLDSETLTIAGGTGLTTTGSGNTLTVDIDSTVATLTGTQTLTNKTLTSPDINTPDIDGGTIDGTAIGGTTAAAGSFTTVSTTGNITVGGTVDGRDVATDGTKLDGIETGATADQTAAEIRSLVESATDSNVFTDADHTKLDGIETGADVTDSTNVAAAGALMDSEVTNLAQVKAFSSADYATAAQGTLADSAVQPSDNISTLTNDSGFITGNQTITLSGDATGSGTTAITVALAANTVGVSELNLTDGTAGQFLKTDGAGTISFATAPTQQTSFSTDELKVTYVNSGTAGPELTLYHSTPTLEGESDTAGIINFNETDGDSSEFNYGLIEVLPLTGYSTARDGRMVLSVARNGAGANTYKVSNSPAYAELDGVDETFTLKNMDLKFFYSGNGIDFSSTTDASGMTSELLDDYEEGTWTPDISSSSGAFTTMSITGATCSYVKIGKQVTVQGSFNTSNVSVGTASGDVRITGIPFTPANDHARGSCYGALLAGETPIHVSSENSNYLNLWYVSSSTADPATLQVSDLTTGSGTANLFRFTITYEV